MKLSEWIASNGGVTATAKRLGLTTGAISKWKTEYRTPTVKTMLKIVELSAGKVSLETIISETTAPGKTKRCKK